MRTPALPLAPPARARALVRAAATLLPGGALSAVVALAATFVAQLHGGPQMLYALFFGIAFLGLLAVLVAERRRARVELRLAGIALALLLA